VSFDVVSDHRISQNLCRADAIVFVRFLTPKYDILIRKC